MITTKKEFVNVIENMSRPDIEVSSKFEWDLLSRVFILFDSDNYYNKFELRGCMLTSKEYDKGVLKNYYKREHNLTQKYKKWLESCNKPKPEYDYIIVDQKYISKIEEWEYYY